ncbi:hypothetical protein ACROYT_G017083 [Oculina patagonica]
MAERDRKEEQLEQEVESQRRKENKPDEYQEGKRRLSAPSCSAPNPKRAHLTTVGKTENGNKKEDGTQDCNSNPPRLNFEVPKLSDLPKACSKSWNDVELPVDFLLLTVEDCEFLGFFPYLEEPFKSYRKDVGYVWFGYMGNTVGSTKKLKIALMKCSKGSAVPGGSLTVVKSAVSVLRPKSVFSVGACSGLSREKVKLGDVVVSSKLITPTHKTPASRDIATLIRHAADGWNAPLANPDAMEVRVHCDGAVLSCPEVISEDMIQQYPEAIAVDTEGEGVFAAAHDLKTEWVVVKGIKDYADDSQPSSDGWGRFASVMAASVVANMLSDPVVFEEWSNYNQEASPVNTFDVKACKRKLAEHYQKSAKVPTTAWSSVCQVELDQIYTRLSWVRKEQTTAGSSKKELGHYTELFTEKTKNGAVPKRILVQGETGIGKTTFVKKLLVDWSNLETAKRSGNEEQKDALRKFELVVSIDLKKVSRCQTLREVITASHLFPEDEEKSIDDLLSYIRTNQEKVLVVFDGYDEYRTGSEAEEKYGSRSSSPIYKIFHGNILRGCTVLVTTRSSRADEIRGPADTQAEITGFDMSDRKDFMGKMLGSETGVHALLSFLRMSNMEDLARVPLLALFFCLLLEEEKTKVMELVKSKTKLFRAITKHILQHSHRKHSTSHVSKLKEENYKEILAEIGKVALEGLLKGDLMFEFGQLPEKVRGEQSILVGLLQVSEYGPSLEPMEMVSFIHKSIQEYLAAWYITYRCVPEGNLGGIEQQARTLKDCQALENVFPFICGLSDDGAVKVFQHLTSVRISDPTLDLSKTIPDVENETGVPLCDVTSRHRRFSDLVYDSFREVRSKAELLSHYFNCTGRVVLATSNRPISELVPKVNVLTEQVQNFVFSFQRTGISSLQIQLDKEDLVINKSLEFLNCLQLPLTIPESSKVLTVGDLVRKFQVHHDFNCSFRSFLCCRNGQFQFFITELSLECDYDASLFTESTADSVPSSAASLCSEQSCLKFLSSLHCRKLSGQTVKALGAVIRNCKHLNRIVVEHRDDTVCDLLEQVPNPSITKCTLTIGSFRTYWPGIVNLTSAGAVQLASLLSRYNNIISLRLDLNDCCSTAVDTLITSITHKTLERLVLSKITLTPTAAVALGRLLPEMSSLQELEFTGVDGSVLQTNEIEALFAGFNKTLPLRKLTLSGFSVRGCLTPLIKSFLFFPNLRELTLGGFKREFNMDEQNLCHLLESLRLIPNLKTLSVKGILLSQAHCCTAEVNPVASVTHKTLDKLHLDGISLTPAVATVLGRLLPKMSSLQELELTGVDGSILEAKEMEALFGGFNKTLPLSKLTFSGFSVRGCLAPLTKSFQFIPNLKELTLKMLNLDEDDQCGLLESFRFICNNLNSLVMRVKQHGHTSNLLFHFYYYYHFYYYKLDLDVLSLTPAVAAALGRLLSEMSSLKKLRLTGVDGSILEAKEMEALFGGFNKTLPLSELTFSGFSVRGCLAPITKSFRFFPNLRELNLDEFNMDEQSLCLLLESLRFIPNLETLNVKGKLVSQANHCTAEVNPIASITHKTLRQLHLGEINLTSAVAAVLGRSLPEMPSLEKLELTGVDGSILDGNEMEALFGGFNKTLPLRWLTFSGFSVRGCLAPHTKILQFFPSLTKLNLEKLNMDENDLCGLLESFQFIPDLRTLNLSGNPLGHAVRSIVPHVSKLLKLENLWIDETGHSEEDLNYLRDSLKQALPELIFYDDEQDGDVYDDFF